MENRPNIPEQEEYDWQQFKSRSIEKLSKIRDRNEVVDFISRCEGYIDEGWFSRSTLREILDMAIGRTGSESFS